MAFYAVIDTNVLVSSLLTKKSDVATVQVIQRLIAGDFVPLLSQEILNEYSDVLQRPKFGFQKNSILSFLNIFIQTGIIIQPSPSGEILPDMKDLPFYEVTLSGPDDNSFLVTGNKKHFPNKSFIVTPKEFLEILDSKENLD